MDDILNRIAQADAHDASRILEAILARYAVLYPDWDVGTISVHKTEDPGLQVDRMIRMLEAMKDLL